MPISRRILLRTALIGVAGAAVDGCDVVTGDFPGMSSFPWSEAGGERARLTARPPAPLEPASVLATPGLHTLPAGPGPEVLLRVPSGTTTASPLVLTLHGAGGDARGGLAPLLPFADAYRLLLLSPRSQGPTWDALGGRWGPDVRRIDDALAQVFASHRVDPARLAISGFSDGASYALSLGLANADLFTHIIAFSPGFIASAPRVGTPQVYISHGRDDTVLPIERTSRRIVPRLRAAHIPVEVHEFGGTHLVPADIAENAVRWLLRPA
jgi:phospholipase/carboxylesterase